MKTVLVLNVNKNHRNQLMVFLKTLNDNGNVHGIDFDIKIYTRDLTDSDASFYIDKDIEIIRVTHDDFAYQKSHDKVHDLINYEEHIEVAPLRLYAMDQLCRTYEHMVYMDTDIFVSGDVSRLFVPLENDVDIAICREHSVYEVTPSRHWKKIRDEIGINLSDIDYFNNGVMSINLKNHVDGMAKKFMDYETKICYEQCFMNDYYESSRIRVMPCMFNFTRKQYWNKIRNKKLKNYLRNKFLSANVLHYSGYFKPWSDLEIPKDIESIYDVDNALFLYMINMKEYMSVAFEIHTVLDDDFLRVVYHNYIEYMRLNKMVSNNE